MKFNEILIEYFAFIFVFSIANIYPLFLKTLISWAFSTGASRDAVVLIALAALNLSVVSTCLPLNLPFFFLFHVNDTWLPGVPTEYLALNESILKTTILNHLIFLRLHLVPLHHQQEMKHPETLLVSHSLIDSPLLFSR